MNTPKKDLSSPSFPDLMATLAGKVGVTGFVKECYGGVCIEVRDPGAFPWWDVLQELLNAEEDVWLRRRDEKIEVMSKSGMP